MSFDLEMICRLLVASVLGGVIGLEREFHGRPAGFRTHLLVSLGSCLFVVTSLHFHDLYSGSSGTGPVRIDPARIAAQVCVGIGFLGAGAIMRDKASVRGLTTAACLWLVAAVGVACGSGMYLVSVVVTLLAITALLLLKRLESALSRDRYGQVRIWCADQEGQRERLEKLFADCGLRAVIDAFGRDLEKREMYFVVDVKFTSRDRITRLLDLLGQQSGIKRIRVD